jgi:hypothetical protein
MSERAGVAFRRGGPRTPPDARCAEFAAGKEGGGISLPSVSVKDGITLEFEVGFARGVVGEEGVLKIGGGGGGMAIRSSSSFFGVIGASSSIIFGVSFCESSPLSSVFVIVGGGSCIDAPRFSMTEGRRSHVRNDHVVGGCL